MAIYRGTGGSSTTTDETTINAVNQKAAEAATSASNAASSASSAATSASTANTKATQASTSATNAAASASSATQSANAASTSADAALAAQVAAELAETGAVGAESNAILFGNMANTAAADAVEARSFAEAANTSAQTYAAAALSSANDASSYDAAVQANATAAALSETNAVASEAAAATSATNAASSATAANASAVSAAASESSVAANATAAAASETNAAASESAAATSESNASGSATAAANSASAASASASGASTSATNAAASETAAASSATSASASADAALAALDSFDDRYLGQKTSDPTVDNDGNALVAGALYFNTTDDVMKVYEGSTWVAAYASLSGALLQNNNLSDVLNVAAARTNLGLAAVASSGDFNDLINQPSPFDPNTLATVATSGSYTDLINKPTLGTSAATDATAYATAAQGALADSALQSIPDNYLLNTGDAITGNLTFGDNDKAIFGAGSDLEIFHDGNNSYIKESGTGSLLVRGVNLSLQDSSNGENYLVCQSNNEVSMYFDGAKKLSTTSTGIDVTGTATMDGLRVDGEVDVNSGDISLSAGKALKYSATSYITPENNVSGAEVSTAGSFNVKTGSTPLNRLKIDGTTGDISFYEDTGTTAKFFWDASAESLGIGTAAPVAKLDISSSGIAPPIYIYNSGNTADITSYSPLAGLQMISYQSDSGSPYLKTSAIIANADGTAPSELQFWTKTNGSSSASERMRIDSSGNVGIGTSSPALPLHVDAKNNNGALLLNANAPYNTGINWYNGGVAKWTTQVLGDGSNAFRFYDFTSNTERMRIDSSGNVGIGTSSPTGKLSVLGDSSRRTTLHGDHIAIGLNTNGEGGWRTGYAFDDSSNNELGGVMAWGDGNSMSKMGFEVAGAERMAIDSSGNLLVGKTTSDGNTVGSALFATGDGEFVKDNGPSLYLNRKSTDGSIAEFRKDGTTVGSIGTSGGKLYVDLGNWTVTEDASGNLMFATSGTNKMKLDASGNLSVVGDVAAYATL